MYRLAAVAPGSVLVVDGLAYGALDPSDVARIAAPIVALVHHPLALETGLGPDAAAGLRRSEIANLALARSVIVTSQHTAAVLVQDYGVPRDRPLVWREARRSSFASVRGVLVRVGIVGGVLVVLWIVSAEVAMHVAGWLASTLRIAAIASAVWAANTFVRERTRQSIDVLLATPLSARELVLSRVRVILFHGLAVLLLGLGVMLPRWEAWAAPLGAWPAVRALSIAITTVACGTIGLWLGLGQRRPLRATTIAVASGLVIHSAFIPLSWLRISSLATWTGMLVVLLAWWVRIDRRARPWPAIRVLATVTFVAVATVGFVLIAGDPPADWQMFSDARSAMLFPIGISFGMLDAGFREPWCGLLYLVLVAVLFVFASLVDADRKLGRVPVPPFAVSRRRATLSG